MDIAKFGSLAYKMRTPKIENLMSLWRIHSERYREALDVYYANCAELSRLGKKNVPMKKSILREFEEKKIEFLCIYPEDAAKEYLENLSTSQLDCLARDIENVVQFGHAYRTIRSAISDQHRRLNKQKGRQGGTVLSPSPDYPIGTTPRTRISRNIGYTDPS